jgi:hypothetical protein
MINIADLKDIVKRQIDAEKAADEAKYAKDLAMYRDKIKQIHSNVMHYIQEQILIAIKRNQDRVGLRSYSFKEFFAAVNKYDTGGILCYVLDENRKALTAYDKALQEEGKVIREELMEAGVMKIIKNNGPMDEPYIYIYF